MKLKEFYKFLGPPWPSAWYAPVGVIRKVKHIVILEDEI